VVQGSDTIWCSQPRRFLSSGQSGAPPSDRGLPAAFPLLQAGAISADQPSGLTSPARARYATCRSAGEFQCWLSSPASPSGGPGPLAGGGGRWRVNRLAGSAASRTEAGGGMPGSGHWSWSLPNASDRSMALDPARTRPYCCAALGCCYRRPNGLKPWSGLTPIRKAGQGAGMVVPCSDTCAVGLMRGGNASRLSSNPLKPITVTLDLEAEIAGLQPPARSRSIIGSQRSFPSLWGGDRREALRAWSSRQGEHRLRDAIGSSASI